jgi:hypothetical protein
MEKGNDGIYRSFGQHPEDLPELEHYRGIEDNLSNENLINDDSIIND